MFRNIKEAFINMVTSRLFVLILLFLALGGILIYRLFFLQIVSGQKMQEDFQLKIDKTISIPSTRGKIYDRNGELLASNELAYSVTITDVLESAKGKNQKLNSTILDLINIIEANNDSIVNDFNIILNKEGNYEFTVADKKLLRFLADIYGESDPYDLDYAQQTASAEDVINFMAGPKKYEIGEYTDTEKKNFKVGQGYSKAEVLKLVTIRYGLSLNIYTKFIPTVVANDVSNETVVAVMENEELLEGVEIQETTIRRYVDSVYFSHILGYTGKISEEEYQELSAENKNYSRNDIVGKTGMEQVMELYLQGKNGEKYVCVDNLGKIVEVTSQTNPVAGNDIYLTIDKDLQKAVYCLLERKIARILIDSIDNIKEYVAAENASASKIRIPIDDVYFALINNSIIDINHFSQTDAKETEKEVYQSYLQKRNAVMQKLQEELTTLNTPYESLTKEYQVYEYYIATMLEEHGVINKDEIDKENTAYKAWVSETGSLKEYLMEVISQNWINTAKLPIESKYLDSDQVYSALLTYIKEQLYKDNLFQKKIYKYMIRDNSLTGRQVCILLFEQKVIDGTDEEKEGIVNGTISSYSFMIDKIKNLDITPAQLALDPCSGSMVVTDTKTGEVRALVSYPSYDNNRLANTIDADYYAEITADLSKPMWDYATQQLSAPGSTYKPLVTAAALEEQIVSTGETVTCRGIWNTILPEVRCWVYPSSHGSLAIENSIAHSCNYYFCEMGYRLGLSGGKYDSEAGLEKLAGYADLFGLSEKSGVEIAEEEPKISDTDAIRSSIGQGSNNFSTVGLARYMTAVANKGTCYNLSLLDYVSDSNGKMIKDFTPEVRNEIQFAQSTWNTIHEGMRKVIENKKYYDGMTVQVAGKTGTAQQITTRPNHALFVAFAPYDNPEIAIATRIAFGYASDYAAQVTQDVIKYHYKLDSEENLLTGTIQQSGAVNVREQ